MNYNQYNGSGNNNNNLTGHNSFPKRPRSRSPNKFAAEHGSGRGISTKPGSYSSPRASGLNGRGFPGSTGYGPGQGPGSSRGSGMAKPPANASRGRGHYSPPHRKNDAYAPKRLGGRNPNNMANPNLINIANNGYRQQNSKEEYEENTEHGDDELWPEVIDVPHNQWIFTKNDLYEKTPARHRKGKPVAYKDELTYRAKAVQRVIEFATALKLARRTVVAASIFIHRYYMFCDFVPTDYKLVVATCVFIATKSEENLKSIKVIATHLATFLKPNTPVEELEGIIWKNIDAIKQLENEILRVLRFDLLVEMPFDAFDEVFDKIDIPVSEPNSSGAAINAQQARKLKQVEKEKYIKQFYWLPESVISCPVYILYNHYEIAAAAYIFTKMVKNEEVPKLFIQNNFGVGLARIADFIKFVLSCYDHFLKTDVRVRTDAELLQSFNYTLEDLVAAVNGDQADVKQGKNEVGAQQMTSDLNGSDNGGPKVVVTENDLLPKPPSAAPLLYQPVAKTAMTKTSASYRNDPNWDNLQY